MSKGYRKEEFQVTPTSMEPLNAPSLLQTEADFWRDLWENEGTAGPELTFKVRPQLPDGDRRRIKYLDDETFVDTIAENVRLLTLRNGAKVPVLWIDEPIGLSMDTDRMRGRQGLSMEDETKAIGRAGIYAAARPGILAHIGLLKGLERLAEEKSDYSPKTSTRMKRKGELAFWQIVKGVNSVGFYGNLAELEAHLSYNDTLSAEEEPEGITRIYEELVVSVHLPEAAAAMHHLQAFSQETKITLEAPALVEIPQTLKMSREKKMGLTGIVILAAVGLGACAGEVTNAETGEVIPTDAMPAQPTQENPLPTSPAVVVTEASPVVTAEVILPTPTVEIYRQMGFVPAHFYEGVNGQPIRAESSGGILSTEFLKQNALIPIALEDGTLVMDNGSAWFLPRPDRMWAPDGETELFFNQEQSRLDVAVYTTENGEPVLQMITMLPKGEGFFVGVVNAQEGAGWQVVGVGVTETGEPQFSLPLVFGAENTIRIVTGSDGRTQLFVNGHLHEIDRNNNTFRATETDYYVENGNIFQWHADAGEFEQVAGDGQINQIITKDGGIIVALGVNGEEVLEYKNGEWVTISGEIGVVCPNPTIWPETCSEIEVIKDQEPAVNNQWTGPDGTLLEYGLLHEYDETYEDGARAMWVYGIVEKIVPFEKGNEFNYDGGNLILRIPQGNDTIFISVLIIDDNSEPMLAQGVVGNTLEDTEEKIMGTGQLLDKLVDLQSLGKLRGEPMAIKINVYREEYGDPFNSYFNQLVEAIDSGNMEALSGLPHRFPLDLNGVWANADWLITQ